MVRKQMDYFCACPLFAIALVGEMGCVELRPAAEIVAGLFVKRFAG
jgi:hypothetical protein